MPAYVPPSKRPGFVPKETDTPPWSRPPKIEVDTIEDHLRRIESIFSTCQQGTFNYFSYPGIPTPDKQPGVEIDSSKEEEKVFPTHPLGHLIAYIMLFPRAQPLWDTGAELWSHTGSEMMIGDWKGDKINFERPIPVFTGASTKRDRFSFIGWWQMNALREVEPNSPELVDLLETKERAKAYQGGRSKGAWNAALSERWMKTRFTPVPESHERYTELVDPSTLGAGEGAKLLLSVGGLVEELKVLESLESESASGVQASDREVVGTEEPGRAVEAEV